MVMMIMAVAQFDADYLTNPTTRPWTPDPSKVTAMVVLFDYLFDGLSGQRLRKFPQPIETGHRAVGHTSLSHIHRDTGNPTPFS